MNIILPKEGKYNIGENFPWLNIPNTLEGLNPEEKTFDDFQWWAESASFQKWLAANPRQWVADSEDMSKYKKNINDIIREHVQTYIFDNDLNESDVLSFDDYGRINEETEAGTPLSEETKKAIKFHYAYNKLKAEGKIKNITSVDADLPSGAPKAVFLTSDDAEGKSIDETLKGFKMTGLPTASASKIKVVSVTESLPGGKIDADATTESVMKDMFKTAAECAAIGVGVGLAWTVIKWTGGGLTSLYVLRTIRGLAPAAKEAGEVGRFANAGAKAGKFIKGVASGSVKKLKILGSGVVELAKFKNIRNAGVGAYKGAKAALTGKAGAYTIKAGQGGKYFLKSFSKGASHIATEAGSKGAARFVPFVGEVLMAIDAIGSTFNWFGDNQAPKWTEIEKIVGTKGGQAFDPGKIKDGTAITICWKQAAGTGVGIATSFLYSNDTRTTAELFKVGNNKNGDSSIFILTAINSKEIQAALAQHAVALIEIKNEEINSQSGFFTTIHRAVDNEDLDIKIGYIDQPSDIAAQFNFMGICEWEVLVQYYNDASDQYIISDGNAPETYEYYYKTPQKEYVNVSGKLLSSEEIGSKNDDDIQKMFIDSNAKIKKEKPRKNETEEKEKPRAVMPGENGPPKYDFKEKGASGGVNDSENNRELWLTPMVSESNKTGLVIRKFSEFEDVLEYVNSSGEYPEYLELNESGKGETFSLSPEQSAGPGKIAIYSVSDMAYADPADKEYTPGAYKYFIIDPVDFDAAIDSSISVGVNSRDILVDPRRGVYKFKEEEKKEDKTIPSPEVNPDQEEKPKADDSDDGAKTVSDDYFITVDPDDISIKNRKNATVIRDHNFKGGINISDEFLTDKEKEILGIPTWKSVTLAKTFMNGQGEVIKVKLKNRYAPMFNTVKTYEVQDGEAFQIAKKFAKEVEDRIKFQ